MEEVEDPESQLLNDIDPFQDPEVLVTILRWSEEWKRSVWVSTIGKTFGSGQLVVCNYVVGW